MLLLGYTREVAGWVLERGGHAHGVLTVWLAVLAIFVIDFSVNAGVLPLSSYTNIILIGVNQSKRWTGRCWWTRCRRRSRPRGTRARR
jgi:solute carrier family 45 protein 1/2/4